MTIPTLRELVRSRLLLAGLLFLAVNSWASYMFYQVNSYKIFLVLIGVGFLAVWNDLLFSRNAEPQIPWKMSAILLLPIVAGLPGFILHQGRYNYNVWYELTPLLLLSLWAMYLYRGVSKERDLSPFFFFIGLTVFYLGIWALLEKTGYNPLQWGEMPLDGRVKATFGNINYFAGFLVLVIPLLAALALPEKFNDLFSFRYFWRPHSFALLFYRLAFVLACLSLVLTYTRAAQVAVLAGLLFLLFLFGYSTATESWKKRLHLLFWICLFCGGGLLVGLYFLSESLPDHRYLELFSLEGWVSRFAGWQPAWDSIKASPWFGYGSGSSYNLYFQFVDPNARLLFESYHSYNHVHSEFLELLQEGGVVGILLHLFFWIYLLYLLLNVLFSDQASPFLKRVSIGLLCGFTGYFLHSCFSVAPRMVVVRLPLYTMIALSFISHKMVQGEQEEQGRRSIKNRFLFFLPALTILVFVCLTFYPNLMGQYLYAKILREPDIRTRMAELEKMVRRYPDIYALDHLSKLQLRFRKVTDLEKTVSLIDQTLPDYRELGYSKMWLWLLQGNLGKAVSQGQRYQWEQDRYYKPVILLMMDVAFGANDLRLFKQQFQLLARHMLFKSRVYFSVDVEAVKIPIVRLKGVMDIVENKDSFIFKWNEDTVYSFFDVGRDIRVVNSYSMQNKNHLRNYLMHHFAKHPFFDLRIREGFSATEEKQIREQLDYYLHSSLQLQEEMRVLVSQSKEDSDSTSPQERKELVKVEKEQIDALKKLHKERKTQAMDFLEEKTYWQEYLNKEDFKRKFIRELGDIIFPPSMRKKSAGSN